MKQRHSKGGKSLVEDVEVIFSLYALNIEFSSNEIKGSKKRNEKSALDVGET